MSYEVVQHVSYEVVRPQMEQWSMQGVLLTVHLSQAEEYSYSVRGVHLTLHLFCRCTTEVVLLQQGVLLGSLWDTCKMCRTTLSGIVLQMYTLQYTRATGVLG